ncbi:protein phosphatase CheZ [Pararhodospirillum photometricum]|nr:protein phosphatase CheZ [Pararhodospirillum photometricum]
MTSTTSMGAPPLLGGLRLVDEIRALADYIDTARRDLVALRPQDIQERFIPTAADELDAIVQATESATEDIMDAVESLEEVTGRLDPEDADALRAATTRIYEACAFQDITGQRITKVVRTLKAIEERVSAMLTAFSVDPLQMAAAPPVAVDSGEAGVAAIGDRPEDMALLNGPQREGAAMGQDDIDALLNGS